MHDRILARALLWLAPALVDASSCSTAHGERIHAGVAQSSAASTVVAPVQTAPAPAKPATKRDAPTALFEVVKVVDGDTIHVRRNGEIEKLRLLSVDTEERLGKGFQGSPTKPQTVFGEECALWAQKFFASLAKPGEPLRVGLLFPGGVEHKDVYGRLLCHVILPDGTDYDRMLVERGKSPYFNKYGNSTVDHEGFVAAQAAAQKAELGIWNPNTNMASTPGAPSVKRPYDKLLPWWNARAEAIDGFRKQHALEPERAIDCEDEEGLARAAREGRAIEVFGEIDRIFDEASGDEMDPAHASKKKGVAHIFGEASGAVTVLFRGSDKKHGVRVRIPRDQVEKHAALHLERLREEFHQNYAWFRGKVVANERGFEFVSDDPARWRRAGPEPEMPPASK